MATVDKGGFTWGSLLEEIAAGGLQLTAGFVIGVEDAGLAGNFDLWWLSV